MLSSVVISGMTCPGLQPLGASSNGFLSLHAILQKFRRVEGSRFSKGRRSQCPAPILRGVRPGVSSRTATLLEQGSRLRQVPTLCKRRQPLRTHSPGAKKGFFPWLVRFNG